MNFMLTEWRGAWKAKGGGSQCRPVGLHSKVLTQKQTNNQKASRIRERRSGREWEGTTLIAFSNYSKKLRGKMSLNSLFESHVIPKQSRNTTKGENCRARSLVNNDAKVLSEYPQTEPNSLSNSQHTGSSETNIRDARMARYIQIHFHKTWHQQNKEPSHAIISVNTAKAFHKTQHPCTIEEEKTLNKLDEECVSM